MLKRGVNENITFRRELKTIIIKKSSILKTAIWAIITLDNMSKSRILLAIPTNPQYQISVIAEKYKSCVD